MGCGGMGWGGVELSIRLEMVLSTLFMNARYLVI